MSYFRTAVMFSNIALLSKEENIVRWQRDVFRHEETELVDNVTNLYR